MSYLQIELEVLQYINKVRCNPKAVVDELEGMLQYFNSKTYRNPITKINIATNEVFFCINKKKGREAVLQAISFQKAAQPMTKLSLSKGLVQAAKDHCYDIGRQGMISHTGSDGSSMGERMERYGSWNVAIAENISFSEKTAKDIVLQFIIDDGNLSRGHRKNIMNNKYLSKQNFF